MKFPGPYINVTLRILLIAASATLVLQTFAHAESRVPYCSEDTCFPKTTNRMGTEMPQHSRARYRYYGFSVFDSALYTSQPDAISGDFLGKIPHALRLCYLRSLTAEEFIRSARETLDLHPENPNALLADRIKKINAGYQSVQPGDCYQLTFVPGKGTELSLNDKPVVAIEGDDFARYYFGIWLSKYSFSESLTEKLTGKR